MELIETKMDKFCVITNADKDREYETARYIATFLTAKGKSCLLIRDRFTEEFSNKYMEISEMPLDTECVIVLGGDGTMIQAANDLHDRKIPMLGVNLGTLGFLTEVEKHEIEESLEKLFQGKYRVEKRVMLTGSVISESKDLADISTCSNTALNDFVITKSGGRRLIKLEVYVDEEFIDTYVADGLIISTPTGSTGYNLSAGGPVLAPAVQAMIITPICPHSLNKRSLVVDSGSVVRVCVGKTKEISDDEAVVIQDGNEIAYMRTGENIEITKSREQARIIKLEGFSFFKRMRMKLGGGIPENGAK